MENKTMALKTVTCRSCGEQYDHRRRQLGYNFCLDCGDFRAQQIRSSWCVAPIAHKQGATLVTNPKDLKGLNKYAM
jgi:ribosomal protein L37E